VKVKRKLEKFFFAFIMCSYNKVCEGDLLQSIWYVFLYVTPCRLL